MLTDYIDHRQYPKLREQYRIWCKGKLLILSFDDWYLRIATSKSIKGGVEDAND